MAFSDKRSKKVLLICSKAESFLIASITSRPMLGAAEMMALVVIVPMVKPSP